MHIYFNTVTRALVGSDIIYLRFQGDFYHAIMWILINFEGLKANGVFMFQFKKFSSIITTLLCFSDFLLLLQRTEISCSLLFNINILHFAHLAPTQL